MKTIILLLFTLTLSVSGKSQTPEGKGTTSGKIVYQETAKLEIKLEGDAAQYADALPKEQVSSKILFFNPDISLYRADDKKKDEDVMNSHSGGMRIRMIIDGENDKIFCDLVNKKKTEQKEFMTRVFLIDSDLSKEQWKMTGNFYQVLGYNCQEAVLADTARKVKAWFTPSIPVSSGPAGYGGLPGLILKVDIDNSKQIITATAIDPSFTVSDVLLKPTEGKKVTKEEFKKIVAEKMKEMGQQEGAGTNHVIIRINN